LAAGRTAARAKAAIAAPLGRLVSNIKAGPVTPRASRLTTASTCRASGLRSRKARAPIRPASSPSSNSSSTGRFSGRSFSKAAVSSITATPMPSSAAPGPTGVES
jgi:hypothetical protein